MANAEDCESVPAPPAGTQPSVPVSNENSGMAAEGFGSTVTVTVAWFVLRRMLSRTM